MKDYAQPTTKENPYYILNYVGTNDFPTRRQPDVIAEYIIQLTKKIKKSSVVFVKASAYSIAFYPCMKNGNQRSIK